MTPPELDEARALLAGLRGIPWMDKLDTARPDWHLVYNSDGLDVAHIPPWMAAVEENAAFIARAPSLLRWAVARIEALERQVRLLSTPFADVMAELGLTDADLDGDEGDDEAR